MDWYSAVLGITFNDRRGGGPFAAGVYLVDNTMNSIEAGCVRFPFHEAEVVTHVADSVDSCCASRNGGDLVDHPGMASIRTSGESQSARRKRIGTVKSDSAAGLGRNSP